MPISSSAAAPTRIPSKCSGIGVTSRAKPCTRSFPADVGAVVGVLEGNPLYRAVRLGNGALQMLGCGSNAQHAPPLVI